MHTRKAFCTLLTVCLAAMLGAQNLSLAEFNLATTGFFREGESTPNIISEGAIAFRYVPSDWLRVKARGTLETSDTVDFFQPVTDLNEPASLAFDGASAEFHEPGNRPVSITLFTGYYDDPASGSLLRELQKTEIPEPEFHSSPSGNAFSPVTEITGTGIALTSAPPRGSAILGMYGYWNNRTGSDASFTCDFRIGGAYTRITYNLFGGLTFASGEPNPGIRTGLTTLFGTDSGNTLYLAAGLRNFTPGTSTAARNLYFIFEPRIRAGAAELSLAFFSSPVFPENVPSWISADAESNYLGSNIGLAFGDGVKGRVRGGINPMGTINPEQPAELTPFSFSISPFISARVSDFVFELTAAVKPLLIDDPLTMGEIRASVKAVY